MSAPTVGSLFAGIGGYDLGLAAVGYEVRWTVELGDFPDEVLAARFPDVERFRDIRDVKNPPAVDVLTGGFPCQDLSAAGKGTGIGGERSGLWSEYARIIGEVEPKVVLVENVPMLLRRGMEVVVKDLVDRGYSVEWDCLPAAAFGAPHLRDRVWIVAHRGDRPRVFGQPAGLFPHDWHALPVTDAGWLKWPRAGYVDGDGLLELEPLAPAAAFRRGANTGLLPTPAAHPAGGVANPVDRDGNPPAGFNERWYHPDTGRVVQKDLGHAVTMRGGAPVPAYGPAGFVPTPQAADGLGGRNEDAALGRAEGDEPRTLERPSGAKAALTLATYARGIETGRFPAPRLWPTPRAHAGSNRRTKPTPGMERGDAGYDLAAAVNAGRLWPTPRASSGESISGGGEGGTYRRTPSQQAGKHGLYLQTEVIEAEVEAGRIDDAQEERIAKGQLNPDWVEWLMGFPLGWTDPAVPADELRVAPWEDGEPDGLPRVTVENVRRRERLTALGNALVPRAAAWLGARARPLLDTDDTVNP